MTWGEIQIISLQKMFLNDEILDVDDLDIYKEDDKYSLYLANMPASFNECANLLMNITNPIIKTYTITQEEIDHDDESWTPVQVYNMKTLVDDFKDISNIVYSYYDETTGEYVDDFDTTKYKVWSDSLIQLKTDYVGTWTVYYKSYHTKITSSTLDTVSIEYDREVNTLIPYYIASELYKEDDLTLSVTYRNLFESGIARLKQHTLDNEKGFESNSGWL